MEDSGKIRSIIAHITIVGWVVAVLMNNKDRNDTASFYIRQMLGIILIGVVGTLIPYLGVFIGLAVVIMWIISLVGAINGTRTPIPYIGQYFQDWFKNI